MHIQCICRFACFSCDGRIHGTWYVLPCTGTLQWHCIDHILVRQGDLGACTDVSVIRNAECGSDHQLLHVSWDMSSPIRFSKKCTASRQRQRFDVARLRNSKPSSQTDTNDEPTPVDLYRSVVGSELTKDWNEQANIASKWNHIKSALDTAATSVLGFSRRQQRGWFQEATPQIQPLLRDRNAAYKEWIQHGQHRDHPSFSTFKSARSKARSAIDAALVKWIEGKALAATESRFNGAIMEVHPRSPSCRGRFETGSDNRSRG